MDKRYARLKLKMLLRVILGTLATVALGLLLLELVMDGAVQDPFARAFAWVAQHWMGYSAATADALYRSAMRNHKDIFITIGAMLLMLVAFYLAMGRFTKWLDQIGSAVRKVVDETGEAVQLPRELAPLAADLAALQRTLGAREAAAKESEQRRSDLVSFLAHDLKTPLTSVLGYLNLLHDEPELPREQQRKYTDIALDKAVRLEALISEFFDITRMDLAELDTSTPIRLSILLEQLADEFYPAFEEKNLRCVSDIAPQLLTHGDPEKLARVFDNVLRNAVSYSSPGGQIDIEAGREGGMLVIAVRNEGLAIPEQELSNIFNKFYRLDAARSTRTGGAGLGLAIAREIVERHCGTIQAESDGKRTSFVIRLPDGDGTGRR